MALNWDITKTKHEGLTEIGEDLVWATMVIGLNKITEDNWEEFWTRREIFAKLSGYDPLKPEEVRNWIGLSTNASRMTLTQFHKHMMEHIRHSLRYKLARLKEREAREALKTNSLEAEKETNDAAV